MTNVPFDNWARPQVRDLLCFAEGSDRRGSRIADLYALKEEGAAPRVTIWAADILSLMQSAFEEGWRQGNAEADQHPAEAIDARGQGDPGPDPQGHDDCRTNPCQYCATDDEPEPEEYDPGPEVDDQGGMSEYRPYEPEPWT